MKKVVWMLLVVAAIMGFAVPSVWAAPVDLSGVWVLPYPVGNGSLALEKTQVLVSGITYNSYRGMLTLPMQGGQVRYPVVFNGDGVSYAEPGRTLSFTTPNGPTQWLAMTVGQNYSSVWLIGTIPGSWIDKNLGMKVNAYR